MIEITVLYFASLRDAAGVAEESLHTQALDLRALYLELHKRYGFALPAQGLRVAVDGEFADWATPLRAGLRIAFIPPVSGG